MITKNSNALEVNRYLEKALIHYYNKITNDLIKFKKRCKNIPKNKTAYNVQLVKPQHGDEQFIIYIAKQYGTLFCDIYAAVELDGETWIYEGVNHGHNETDAYSLTFYKRYAERTGRSYKFPDIIGIYKSNNNGHTRLYCNKDTGSIIYASKEGISLCKWDKGLQITKFHSFIPCGMFNETQRSAWELIQRHINKLEDIWNLHVSHEVKDRLTDEWTREFPADVEFAIKIYEQYENETN